MTTISALNQDIFAAKCDPNNRQSCLTEKNVTRRDEAIGLTEQTQTVTSLQSSRRRRPW